MNYLERFAQELNVTLLVNFDLMLGINTERDFDKYQLISSDKEAMKKS